MPPRKQNPSALGMSNPTSAEGKTCQWCEAPATEIATVRPARTVNNEIIEWPITAAVCDQHKCLVVEDPQHPDALRRKHAKGVEQTSIFDSDKGGPRSAIYGDAA